jgi:hypothetical protein
MQVRLRAASAYNITDYDRATTNMSTQVEIRRATAGDAEAVYEIVLRALRETNARDYPASVIDRLVLTLPKGVASTLEEWHAYVAVVDGRTVGTGSLNGNTSERFSFTRTIRAAALAQNSWMLSRTLRISSMKVP